MQFFASEMKLTPLVLLCNTKMSVETMFVCLQKNIDVFSVLLRVWGDTLNVKLIGIKVLVPLCSQDYHSYSVGLPAQQSLTA